MDLYFHVDRNCIEAYNVQLFCLELSRVLTELLLKHKNIPLYAGFTVL